MPKDRFLAIPMHVHAHGEVYHIYGYLKSYVIFFKIVNTYGQTCLKQFRYVNKSSTLYTYVNI